MKNLLLLVHDDAGQEARFQAALDLTRALEGHLTCLDVTELTIIAGDYDGGASAILLADALDREHRNGAAMKARLINENVAWDWIDAVGDLAGSIRQVAGLTDLIVLSRQLDDFPVPDMRDIAATTAMHARKPIVAVPQKAKGFDASGTAVIAWDGSPPVMNTMRACTPLLKLAQSVIIFTAGDRGVGISAEEAATYLSRHDISPSIKETQALDLSPDTLITEICEVEGAAYCLMGAYGHSRIAERLFGGVTQRMLASSRVPLVLGH